MSDFRASLENGVNNEPEVKKSIKDLLKEEKTREAAGKKAVDDGKDLPNEIEVTKVPKILKDIIDD